MEQKRALQNAYSLFIWPYLLFVVTNLPFETGRFGFSPIDLVPVVLAIALVVWRNPLYLALAALSGAACTILNFPTTSNHMIMALVFNSCLVISFLHVCLDKKTIKITAEDYYQSFAPAGRLLLLTMYFFGTFQKINADFLNPDLSYGTFLLQFFPFLSPEITKNLIVQYTAIYGTLILEASVLFFLIFRKTRYLGVCLGVSFHLLISFNTFRNYIPFSMLCCMLHSLFMSPIAVDKYKQSRIYTFLTQKKYKGILILLWICFVAILFLVIKGAMHGETVRIYYMTWIPLSAVIIWFAFYFDAVKPDPDYSKKDYFLSHQKIAPALVAVFFISCFSPYVGLKNAQVLSMFSNLKTEDGYSNHLIIRQPFYIFDNLTHSVRILATNNPDLISQANGYRISPFLLEYHMSQHPEYAVHYEQDGKIYNYPDGISKELAHEWKKPEILYRLMAFRPIDIHGRGF